MFGVRCAFSARPVREAKQLPNPSPAGYYFELRSADAQQRLLDATVDQYTDMVKLTTALLKGGAGMSSNIH
jgi:hypothetical protein